MNKSNFNRILDEAAKEVASWPEWKKQFYKVFVEDLAKPYPKNRLNYPVVGGGFIV